MRFFRDFILTGAAVVVVVSAAVNLYGFVSDWEDLQSKVYQQYGLTWEQLVYAITTVAFLVVAGRLLWRTAKAENRLEESVGGLAADVEKEFRFFDHRPKMAFLTEKVHMSREVWAAYIIGGSASNATLLDEGHFTRLLLAHPANPALRVISELQPSYDYNRLRSRIHEFIVDAVGRRIAVRRCRDMVYSLLTIGNPPTEGEVVADDTWVFVEAWVPGIEAYQRPSFFAIAKEHPALCGNIIVAFNALWDRAEGPVN